MAYGRGSIAEVVYTGDEGGEVAIAVRKLLDNVAANEDDFDLWAQLVTYVEGLEGGLTRNSSPSSIELFRNVYDHFLAKFPLFFGYWKKYADAEFTIGGSEAAELVYERGVSCVQNSVDLWVNYCIFKETTTHDPDIMRELYERAAQCVGLDYMSHPFWDKYLELERRFNNEANMFKILERIIHIPMHQYGRYFSHFQTMAATRPVEELAPPEVIRDFTNQLVEQFQGQNKSQLEFERELRGMVDRLHLEINHRTSAETQKRWPFEEKVKRPYFHVHELEETELANWRKYLDFEEAEGDYVRTVFLYERCVVTCALYDEFWFRYIRWMSAKEGKEEEVHVLYMRAAVYVPIARYSIRLLWARFEESVGRVNYANLLYDAVLDVMGPNTETIVAKANTIRRYDGVEAAVAFYEDYINTKTTDIYLQGALVAEQARLLWKVKGSADEARKLFSSKYRWYLDSRYFLINWLQFEIDSATTGETEEQTHERVKKVHDLIRKEGRLGPHVLRDLSHHYMVFLLERCGKTGAKEYVVLDREVNGYVQSPPSPPSSPLPHRRAKSALTTPQFITVMRPLDNRPAPVTVFAIMQTYTNLSLCHIPSVLLLFARLLGTLLCFLVSVSSAHPQHVGFGSVLRHPLSHRCKIANTLSSPSL
ncbi:hypothetical protein GQ43DRAFT_190895 [Delitschia confertaspora ATCC 74209]|uniref:Suppressor of forked domain-containing protein n=1 Tax=Delitschia confertaspora ATCC 74209 TaxID=1513339 RepID=A0A9P4JE42_9PLEO|nr:hypothetical protein GQ43DRAFT_190895 [Delitschia confertaspora ATCC 74209]